MSAQWPTLPIMGANASTQTHTYTADGRMGARVTVTVEFHRPEESDAPAHALLALVAVMGKQERALNLARALVEQQGARAHSSACDIARAATLMREPPVAGDDALGRYTASGAHSAPQGVQKT